MWTAVIVILILLHSLCCDGAETATTGSFTIHFDSDSLPFIKVTQGDSLVWFSSTTTKDFLVAVKVEQTVDQNGGNYIINDNIIDQCNDFKFDTDLIQSAHVVLISGILCDHHNFTLSFKSIKADKTSTFEHLQFNLSIHSNYFNQMKFTYGCDIDEGFYGLGEQYTYINMKGHSVPMFISEQGVGRGAQPITFILNYMSPGSGGNAYTTYSRVPFYLTSQTRSLSLESLDYCIFHFTKKDSVTIETNNTNLYGRIITGNSSLEILESYTAYAGRMKPLPKWVHSGAILGLQGGVKIVTDVLDMVKKVMGGLSDVTGVWLQDWSGQRNITGSTDLPRTGVWWNWEVDRQQYPKWEEFINSLRSEGIQVMVYINPLLLNISKRGTPYNHNYYEEGLDGGYFIKQSGGEVWTGYSNSCLVDLTNPKAYDWIMNMIVENILASNVSGWMCDFGESVPMDAVLYSGQDPTQYHTIYSAVWGQLNNEAVENALKRKLISQEQASNIVYFMRSGSTHSPKVTPLFWLGDQLVSWDHYDGLGSAIIGAITSGLSGFTLTHSDIGGYTSIKIPIPFLSYIRSKHLFMRWCEFSAFNIIYRSHQGTCPDDNWQFYSDQDTMKHYFRMSRVHQAWKFYRNTLMTEAADHGWPVIRHMLLVFPNNPSVYKEDLRYQFMIGTEILVAPIHEEWSKSVKVFLPEGITWLHAWTNISHQGNNMWIDISSPLGYPVALYPKGSRVGEEFAGNLMKIFNLPILNLNKTDL